MQPLSCINTCVPTLCFQTSMSAGTYRGVAQSGMVSIFFFFWVDLEGFKMIYLSKSYKNDLLFLKTW